MSNQITLRIHSVKCVDETGGKWDEKFGNDEIFLAGYSINDNLDSKFVRPFEVYAHFDDGEIKRFSPPKMFAALAINNNSAFPKNYFVAFLLAEKDRGDFNNKAAQVYNELVEELAKKAREELRKRNANVISEDIKKFIVEKVLEELYSWIRSKIISTANDEIFPLRYTQISIPSADFNWNGNRISPTAKIEFRGHDGVYVMTYDWELS